MDYDSSSKFISSLAKFLQSLCNGYVEFDSGVQVIGHLYLSVDTGKTIDYILNEKVCKTDENSVMFISNSFHAQPAEKPKPPGKKPTKDSDKIDAKNEEESDFHSGSQTEPKSTNVGTMPLSRSLNQNSPHSQGAKRPYSPSHKQSQKSGHTSPKHKRSRNDVEQTAHSQLSNPPSENSISSLPSPAPDGGPLQSSHSANAQLNESYQHNFFQPEDENSLADESEERDIKPSIDTDVTFIKEEYAPSSSGSQSGSQSHDRTHGDDSSLYQYQSNPVFPGSYAGSGAYGTPQRSNYSSSGSSHMFSPNSGQGSSKHDDSTGDPSEIWLNELSVGNSSAVITSPNSLSTLITEQSAESQQSSICGFCKKILTTSLERRTHRLVCKRMNNVSCPECGTLFRRKDNLRVHMRNQHNIGDPTVCRGCGMCFRSYRRLNEHMNLCQAANSLH